MVVGVVREFFSNRKKRREEREELERHKAIDSIRAASSSPQASPHKPPPPPQPEPAPQDRATTSPLVFEPRGAVRRASQVTFALASSSSESSSSEEEEEVEKGAEEHSAVAAAEEEPLVHFGPSEMDAYLRDFGLDPYGDMLREAGFNTPLTVSPPPPPL